MRAVILARLRLPAWGVLWDLGAGSGSVGLEAATLRPRLHVFGVERKPERCAMIEANKRTLGITNYTLHAGELPEILAFLPPPDRILSAAEETRSRPFSLRRMPRCARADCFWPARLRWNHFERSWNGPPNAGPDCARWTSPMNNRLGRRPSPPEGAKPHSSGSPLPRRTSHSRYHSAAGRTRSRPGERPKTWAVLPSGIGQASFRILYRKKQ